MDQADGLAQADGRQVVYNFLGIKPEQQFVSSTLKPGKYTLGVEFTKESVGKYHESLGKAKLYVNDKVVAEGPLRTQAGKFTLSGDGLCVGRDSGDNVSQEYKTPGEFKAGITVVTARRPIRVAVGRA